MRTSKFTETQIASILKQEANDLFFGKALLHVQSPSRWGLNSKSLCYSKLGGRRRLGSDVHSKHPPPIAPGDVPAADRSRACGAGKPAPW